MASVQAQARRRPVIAILTAKDRHRSMRGRFSNFSDIIRVGKKLGATVYVTTAEDIRSSHNNIVGLYYSKQAGMWMTKSFPAPHVIYNRIPFRKYEAKPEIQQMILNFLQDRKVRLFNPFFFNKWTLYEWLSRAKSTKSSLPKTEKLTSPSILETYLEQHAAVYLKPIHGKAGKGIMQGQRIKQDGGPKYRLIHSTGKKRHVHHFWTIPEMWLHLKQKIGAKEYIIQQAIDLTKSHGHPFDLRILVQKNHTNTWQLTGIGARVAGKRSITTHVPRGGSIRSASKVLKAVFGPTRAQEIKENAGTLAIVIAEQIEKSSGYELGEMSMDVGVDSSGKLWFFEANSKPMKFDEPRIRRKSLKTLIQYCIYLSSQSTDKYTESP
ncbi:YheC/YheD family endospore coat-associated protein [Paenibacillus guangzhouensis]|uniref:YheC/YheD family endospore coat-associated protein n=1 Tax=Paenibacillus guangzhouensis TaxID=1473112 RepID=UPI0012670C65|nr:YheC/YheD family protein [Paenibacillus guangzhouensis]